MPARILNDADAAIHRRQRHCSSLPHWHRNLSDIIRQADIPVVAMGVPGAITAEMVRGGAVVIYDDRCAMI